jgi:hypothetical protein
MEAPGLALVQERLEAIEEACALLEDAREADTLRWSLLYGRDTGLHSWSRSNKLPLEKRWYWHERGGWQRIRTRMSRREWIERHVKIKTKGGEVQPLKLNQAQRVLEAKILRMERAGLPVRIQILKGRQLGMSTYIQAVLFWAVMTIPLFRVLMVAHRKSTMKSIFAKIHFMRRRLCKQDGKPFDFLVPVKSREALEIADPIGGSIIIDSAEVDEPGHGETVDGVHNTETSRWPNAAEKAKGIDQVIPEKPWTYAFDESTANGDTGYFRDKFWRCEAKQSGENVDDEEEFASGWQAIFLAWWLDPQYRWSAIFGKPPTEEHVAKIESTLTDDERWMLRQQYLVHGKGWVNVDYDCIAWWRYFLQEKLNGDTGKLLEQYPPSPRHAFIATGRPCFETELLDRVELNCQRDPIWRGEIVLAGAA